MTQLIECPNHQGAFDCNSFCRLCEGEQETTLDEMISQAHSVSWDSCHKIYLNMDERQTEKMFQYDYDKTFSGSEQEKRDYVFSWYEDSCSLRFIEAVFTEEDDTDRFVTLVSQFETLAPNGINA